MATGIYLDSALRDFSEEKVILVIGPDMLTWYIDRKVLERSDHFCRMLQSQWLKKKPRMLDLPQVEPTALRAYLHFLSTDEVPDLACDTLAGLHVYGHQISDTSFKNATLDALITRVQATTIDGRALIPSRLAVGQIYDATSAESLARKLMVDIYYHFAEPDTAFAWNEYHEDFRRDLALRYLEENRAHYKALLDGLILTRLAENQSARRNGRRGSWDVTRFNYHEGFSHYETDASCTVEHEEEQCVNLAMGCRDAPWHGPAKRHVGDINREERWVEGPTDSAYGEKSSLLSPYEHERELPGTYFPTGA